MTPKREVDGLVSARPARGRRRRAALVACVAGAVVVVAGVVVLALPRHDDRPAPVQALSVFPAKIGSERFIAEAVNKDGSAAEAGFEVTSHDLVVRTMCSSRDRQATLEIDIDGVRRLPVVCTSAEAVEGDDLPLGDLAPGHHLLQVRLRGGRGGDATVWAGSSVGAAVYDASDRVDVAGADLERVVVIDGREWTPDATPLRDGLFTPSTDVYVNLFGGRDSDVNQGGVIHEIRLRALDPHGHDVGSSWAVPSARVRLVAGTRYRIALARRTRPGQMLALQGWGAWPPEVSHTTDDGKVHIVVYRPVG